MYYLYMIKNSENELYVGISKDISQRIDYHNNNRGSKFTTKSKSNFNLVFQEEHPTLAAARKREIQIKKWSRIKKEILVEKFRQNIQTKNR